MHPIICSIGPFTIFSYGLMLVIGFFLASHLVLVQARRQGMDADAIFNLCFIGFMCGIIGARVFYIVEHPAQYLLHPLEVFRLQEGGLSWFGGFFGGVIASFFYARRKKLALYRTLDLIVPFIALAQAIGRIGCLLNGCCYGKVAAWGMYFPVHEAYLVPSQIYSSLLLIVIYCVLRFLQDRPHWVGQIFYMYLLLYAIKRFAIEFVRADNPPILWGLSLFQFISFGFFLLAAYNLFMVRRRA